MCHLDCQKERDVSTDSNEKPVGLSKPELAVIRSSSYTSIIMVDIGITKRNSDSGHPWLMLEHWGLQLDV